MSALGQKQTLGNAAKKALFDRLVKLRSAVERAKSAKPEAVIEALHDGRFEGGWTKAMPGAAIQFDQTGLNTLSTPIMVQWRNKELATVWPKDTAKASPVWHS
jgi:branched-chain amino acid transport system substrate-binding protein